MACKCSLDHSRSAHPVPSPGWLVTALLTVVSALPVQAAQIDILGPPGSSAFGTKVIVLPNGNIVVTDPDDLGPNISKVYLYSPTGVLLSTLTGSSPGDQVGSGGISVLANGNYVIKSPNWDNGSTADVGAVTWGDASAGVSGVISPANSLIGGTLNDRIGEDGVTALDNGNYVVSSRSWDSGAGADVGAATWGDGSSGIVGLVSVANSLIGTTAGDRVGGSVRALGNGHYVVLSGQWSNAGSANAGAVTWGNGNIGVSGAVTAANSLVGTQANDNVGAALVTLSNSNYVVSTSQWDDGLIADVGAVTWGNGNGGTVGAVSVANSLIGSSIGDQVGGAPVIALSNGNYVVSAGGWDNGGLADAGAATWGNGSSGTSGPISAANSLIGTSADDNVGRAQALVNGHYVVVTPNWKSGSVAFAGAVTWGNGNGGTSGAVSTANSITGQTFADRIGAGGVTALSNGNFVVNSYFWGDGSTDELGAITWVNGSAGSSGVVSAANSLIGSTTGDFLDSDLTALANGNYVVNGRSWDNGVIADAGAVTWGNGTSGSTGIVSVANSLIGTSTEDFINAGVTALNNGNYVVFNRSWDSGALADAGAVTWGNGSSGVSGVVSGLNSLVGAQADDRVGNSGGALSNGNYVVVSRNWDNGLTANVGAVTWGDGGGGLVGVVAAANSLIGTTTGDALGSGWGELGSALANGFYAIRSPNWDNGAVANAGSISLAKGSAALIGTIDATNSVRGTATDGGGSMVFSFDAVREQLAVGRPASNTVSLLTFVLFASNFE